MSNINKVVYGNITLIDITEDTVTANKMISGITAHDKSGSTITGTMPKAYEAGETLLYLFDASISSEMLNTYGSVSSETLTV